MPHHLGLHDHPTLAAPLPSRVTHLAKQMLGFATGLGEHARAAHQPAAPLDEARIGAHGHDVLDGLGLQEVQHLGAGKAPVESDPKDRSRKRDPQPPGQARQHPGGAPLGRTVARAQDGGDQVLRRLGVERQRRHQRQVAPGVVVPVEEGELLLSVGGVVGRVDVDRDAAGAALESGAMVLDDQIGQSHTGQVQRGPIDGVLEAGESWLRG